MGKGIEGAGSPSTRRVEQPKQEPPKQEQVKNEPSQQRAGREEQAQAPSRSNADKNQDVRNARGESNFESAPTRNNSRMPDLMLKGNGPAADETPTPASTSPAATGTPTPPHQSNGTQPTPVAAPTPIAPPAAPQKKPEDYDPAYAQDVDEAGRRLADQNSPRYTDTPELRAQDLTSLSQNRPDAMASAYQQLGPERSADLIGQSVRNISADNLTDQQKADQVQALGNGFSQASVTDQVNTAQAAAVDPTRANAMGLVLKQQGPSDAARTAFVDATWDKATATNGDYQTPLYARASMDALSGSQDLVNARLASDPAGTVQAMSNGRQIGSGAYANNVPALKSDGLEKVVGMAGNFHGEGAAKVHADILTTLGKELGDKSDPSQADLVKGLGNLYLSNAGELSRSMYSSDSSYRSPKNSEIIPRLIRDGMFNGQDPDFGTKLGQSLADMAGKDPVGAGATMELVQQGYQRASAQISADKESRDKMFGVVKDFASTALTLAVPEASPLLVTGLNKVAEYALKGINDKLAEAPQEQIATMNMRLQDAARPRIPDQGQHLSQVDRDFMDGGNLVEQALRSTQPVK